MAISFECVDRIERLRIDSPYNPKFLLKEPHPSTKIDISFNLTCRSFTHGWLASRDASTPPLQRIHQITLPVTETYFSATNDELSNHVQAQLSLNRHLLNWPIICAINRRALVSFILQDAREALQVMPDGFNAIEIDIPVNVFRNYIYRQLMEEYDVRMVPAAEWAINEFVKGVVVTEEMNCGVCLEEMKGGGEGMAMPCSHVFHQDCIMRWLRTSHNCPICRSELPTS